MRIKYIFIKISFFLIFISFSSNAFANTNNVDYELKQLMREIRKEEAAIKKLRGEKAATVKRINVTESKIKNYKKVLNILNSEINSLTARLKEVNREIDIYQSNINRIKKDVARSNIFVIDNLGYSYIKIIATSKKPEETVKTLEILSKANKSLDDKVVELNSNIEKLDELTNEQRNKLNSLSSMKREKDSALKALNREQLEYERELTLLRNDEAGRIEYVEMLEFRRKELDEKIKNNVSSETNNISSGFGKLKGKLPYPINGKIIDGYGKRYIKEAGVNFFNKGIKIAPKSDTDVLCIYTGNVVFADYMKGFENLVVVSHGDNYYTVYGNLTSLKVSQGDKISSGNSLGTISIDQDYNTSYLYFEIRLKENALNPVEWLISN